MTDQSFDRFFVGGEWVIPSRGARIVVIDPATSEPFGSVPKGVAGDARAAVHAARVAFDEGPWPRLPASERAAALRRFAVEAAIERVRLTETVIAETGCTIRDAETILVEPVLDAMSFYADRATADPERRVPDHAGPPPVSSVLRREPVGTVAAIGASCEPLAALVEECFVALANGNTVVYKPSSLAPLSAMILAECADRAELPPGVFNVVTGPGRGVGDELTTNPLVDAVAFTGRVLTARRVAERAASTLKVMSMHGGTGAVSVVLNGADVEAIAPEVLRAWLAHQGQAAAAATRLVVDRSVHDDLTDRLAAELKGLIIGTPADRSTDVGPIRSAVARDRIERLIADASDQGATVVAGGTRPERRGYYLEPALLTGVTERMEIAMEEPSGPALAVLAAEGAGDALRLAHATGATRAAFVWGARQEDAAEFGRALRCANVFLNGAGQNPWARSLEEFTTVKNVSAPPG